MKIKQNKPIQKSTVITDDTIYEMVHDTNLNMTEFVSMNRLGKLQIGLSEIEINGKKYEPIPADSNLLEERVVLFASMPEPYENEEQILSEIQNFIHKYLDVSEVFEQIATYYVLFTWLYDKFNEVPYLRAIGDFGSGKSRFIQTVGVLCYKPIFTSGATSTAPIFRILSEMKGTLVLDEADFKFSDMTADIVKILNTGYQKGTAVLRCKPNTFDPEAFHVFGPKIIATRETFTDKALESRFLVEEMGSGSLRKDIPRTLDHDFYLEAKYIRNKLLKWRLDNYFKPIKKSSEIIEKIHPRLNQIVTPLLSIIKDESIKEKLKEFIIKYDSDLVADRGMSWESDIVFSILKLQHELNVKELTVKEITDETNKELELGEENLKERKVGWYLRAKLQLKTEKKRRGYTLSLSQNKPKLDMWKERYGITDSDIKGEQVNYVNDVEQDINNKIEF
jgi:hypothetical protein